MQAYPVQSVFEPHTLNFRDENFGGACVQIEPSDERIQSGLPSARDQNALEGIVSLATIARRPRSCSWCCMVPVQNEPGIWMNIRDTEPEKIFMSDIESDHSDKNDTNYEYGKNSFAKTI